VRVVWAYGIVLYELIALQSPDTQCIVFPIGLSKAFYPLKHLVMMCTQAQPDRRPAAHQIVHYLQSLAL